MKKLMIFIPTHNLEKVICNTLDRIPTNFYSKISQILINDNNSEDNTKLVIEKYLNKKKNLPIRINYFSKNIGFGGSKKIAYNNAIVDGFDYVICLHGDGQYPPEELPFLYKLLDEKKYDLVQGSRVDYIKGGMPFYKIIANNFLNFFENLVFNYNFHEYHSGYRGYSCQSLKKIPLEKLSSSHLITAEILALFKINNLKVKDFPIKTTYNEFSSSMKFLPSLNYGIKVFYVLLNCFLSKYYLNFDKLYNKK